MERRRLGKSGLEVSIAGLGCNNFGGFLDLEGSRRVCDAALDLGITFFDTADVYGDRGGSETFLGAILGKRRQHIVLATKFGMPMDDEGRLRGASRRYVTAAVDASLGRLRTDYIDLYQLHCPDAATPIDETLQALDDLVKAGKVRYIGCSNVPASDVNTALRAAEQLGTGSFATCQEEYSLLNRRVERELIPTMEVDRLGLLPYYPLACGLLTGKYRKQTFPPAQGRLSWAPALASQFLTERNWSVIEALNAFAVRAGRSLLHLALGWLASKQIVVSVISGATDAAQVHQNVQAIACELRPAELAELERITDQR